jgi:hypothetical protein
MKIDFCYFDGCASWQEGLKNLRQALQNEGLEAEINLVKVEDDQQANHLKFLGSPSFRSNGLDWWPEERTSFSLSCRLYRTPQGLKGFPTVKMLEEKIRVLGQTDLFS